MFVTSYSTYINTSTSDKTNKLEVDKQKDGLKSFSSELSKSALLETYTGKNLPIDYVSNYKSFNNKQRLQQFEKSQNELELKKTATMNNAKVAYEDNSKMFSLLKKPTSSLNQIKKTDTKLPQNIQDIQKSNLQHTMVNTYMENDRYYQVTA